MIIKAINLKILNKIRYLVQEHIEATHRFLLKYSTLFLERRVFLFNSVLLDTFTIYFNLKSPSLVLN